MSFIEKDVSVDRMAAVEMIRKSGQQGVPVTVIGEEVIVGFDQPRLKQAVARLQPQPAGAAQNSGESRFKLGAKATDAAPVLAGQGKLVKEGALIGQVNPGSPAARAGLSEGDIIIALGSHPVQNVASLQAALSRLTNLPISGLAGETALVYLRDGQRIQARLPLK